MKKITALLSVIIVVSLFAAVIPAVADTDTVFPITEGLKMPQHWRIPFSHPERR